MRGPGGVASCSSRSAGQPEGGMAAPPRRPERRDGAEPPVEPSVFLREGDRGEELQPLARPGGDSSLPVDIHPVLLFRQARLSLDTLNREAERDEAALEALPRELVRRARESAARGQTLSVDLVDPGASLLDPEADASAFWLGEAVSRALGERMALVRECAGEPNLVWSIGSEIGLSAGAPAADLGRLVAFLERWTAELRSLAPAHPVALEIAPGALGNHAGSGPRDESVSAELVLMTMAEILGLPALDLVSLHFFPPVGPWQLGEEDAAFPLAEWSSLSAWMSAAATAGKACILGELGVGPCGRGGEAATAGRSSEEEQRRILGEWLELFVADERIAGVRTPEP